MNPFRQLVGLLGQGLYLRWTT